MPFERSGLLWASRTEGLLCLLQTCMGCVTLLLSVRIRVAKRRVVDAIARFAADGNGAVFLKISCRTCLHAGFRSKKSTNTQTSGLNFPRMSPECSPNILGMFGSVRLRFGKGNGSSGSGFQFWRFLCKKDFSVFSVLFNRKERSRFRFRFLENGSGGSGSAFGFGRNGSDGSGSVPEPP